MIGIVTSCPSGDNVGNIPRCPPIFHVYCRGIASVRAGRTRIPRHRRLIPTAVDGIGVDRDTMLEFVPA